MIIAIDGVAASGKGTLAALLAKHYGCECLFSGNLYRLCAKKLIQDGVDIDQFILSPSKEKIITILKEADSLDDNLGGDVLSTAGSKIATLDAVRQAIIEFERDWIKKRKTAIVEGRDTGTVVWPSADVKLFLVADPNIRARRRADQLHAKNNAVSIDEIYSNIIERDKRDMTRNLNPLQMAEDAILLDTTNMTIEEMQKNAVDLIEHRL